MELNENIDILSKLAYKYLSDKCPQIRHTYTPFYYELLASRQESIKKVLEIGVGQGASLYMWRDFFPNAEIYGADNNPKTLFEDDRIKTFLCDERKKGDLEKLIEDTGSDVDFVVDDGSHHFDDQVFACQTLMPLLTSRVIYIIEDVRHSRMIRRALNKYRCLVPKISKQTGNNQLVIIKHHKHKQYGHTSSN